MIGIGVNIWGGYRRAPQVELDAIPNLYVATGTGITYSITGTATVPDGTAVACTINGVAVPGTHTVAAGAFSIPVTPSDAMAGLSVPVVVTVSGVSKTASARCVGPSLFAGLMLDLRRKVDYALAPAIQTWGDQSPGVFDVSAPAEANQPADGATGPDFSGDASPNGDYLVSSTALGNALGTTSNMLVAVTFRMTADGNGGIIEIGEPGWGLVTVNRIPSPPQLLFRTNAYAQSVDIEFSDVASFHTAMIVVSDGVGTPSLDGVVLGTLSTGEQVFTGLRCALGTVFLWGIYNLPCVIANVLISTVPTPENVALIQEWLAAVKP